MLGVPLFDDECTFKVQRISYARVLIEIDVTKVLPKSVMIEGFGGNVFEQETVYEWVPPFCERCCKVGHDCKNSVKVRLKQSKNGFLRVSLETLL